MENIKFNKQYKYKELQQLFNIYGKSGEQTIKDISKNYIIKKVKRGTYKIIRELTELEKIENNTYNKNKEYLEPMIYSMLLNTKQNSITMDMHELMESVEIVNKDFHYIKYHLPECSEIINLENKTSLKIFTRESEPMLKRIIRDILYEMQDRQLIKINEIPIIAYKIYDYDTKKWFTRTEELTTDKKIQKLLEIKRNILKNEFNIEKESELSYFNGSHFRDCIAKAYDASYFYYKYNIILNKKGLNLCQESNIMKLKKSFNDYIQQKLRNSKQGDLKILTDKEKDICIKYCIDTSIDYNLRNRKIGAN